MTLSDLLPPERVREIAEDVDGNYYDMGWSVTDVGAKAIELAAPEIARAVLEMAWDAISAMIKEGPLPEHKSNERNGLILAANAVVELKDKVERDETR